jgi:hypothetical protein
MSDYKKVYKSISSTIEEQFPDLVKIFKTEFRKEALEWFTDTYNELLKIKKDDPLFYRKKVKLLESRLPELELVLKNISDVSWFEIWEKLISDATDSIPDEVVETQSADRFTVHEGDRVYIKLTKMCKLGIRSLQKTLHIGKTDWKQSIPVKNIVRSRLLESNKVLDTYFYSEFETIARSFDFLFEKRVAKDTDEKSSEALKINSSREFKIEVIITLEEHLRSAVQLLKDVDGENFEAIKEIKRECLETASLVDTAELKKETYQSTSLNQRIERQREKLGSHESTWDQFLKSQFTDLKIQLEIAEFGEDAATAQTEILEILHELFRDYCYLPMENGVTAAKEILKKLKQSKSKTLPSKLVESIRSEVETELKDTLLSPMRNIEEQQKLVKKIQRIISDLQLEVQSFTEKTELAEVRELQKPVPVIDLDEFLWQSIAARFIKQEALKELDPEGRKLDVFIAEMSEEVAEAIQIVDVNLMAAIDSKDQNEEEQSPLEIAVSGLERAINLFEQSIQLVRERQNEYEKSVKEKLPNTLNRLADLMLTKDYDRFELQDKALQAKETALNWRDKFDMLSETVLEKIQLGFRFLTSKLKKANKSAAKYLGFSDDDDAINKTVKRNLTEYLSRFNIDNPLPYVYKRLFDREFEIDQRFFINPEQSFQLFEKSYQDWKKEMDVSVIIIGEKGSGKTTLIRFLRDQFLMDGKMISIDFDKTYFSENELMKRLNKAFGYDEDLTRSEFIEKVENKKSRTVVVIENLNNAYVRNINGFGALESFWVIMASTRDKVFWVTTSTRYAWNFFKKMSGADQYYTHIIEVDNLDEERIKNAILTRHKSTGYSLEFKPDKGIESSRTYRKLLNDQQKSQDFLKDQYFEQLAKVAEGNISIAMIFWMQSVVDFDENTFTIQPLKIADVDMLEVPSREVLFTLAALVIHDTLTSEQMALALHQDVSDSRLMLTRLKSKGILKQDEQGYRLNHLVFRQVVRLLKRKNILH